MPRETSSQPGIAFLVPEFNQTSRDNAYRSLRSRRLEVAGERENGRARGRHACLLLARPFFLVPTTCKRLLRRLCLPRKCNNLWARSIQPKFPEISVQNSMDRFGPTGKVSKKRVHFLRWTTFPGQTGWNFG